MANPTNGHSATLGSVAREANVFYWEVHSLLCSAQSLLSDFDDDFIEVRTVIEVAQQKALALQELLSPHIATNPAIKGKA